jgi:hypothetical protein
MEMVHDNVISLKEASVEADETRTSDLLFKTLGTIMFIIVAFLTVVESVYLGKAMGADKTFSQAFTRVTETTASYLSDSTDTKGSNEQVVNYNPIINLPSIVSATSKQYTQAATPVYISSINASVDAFVFYRGLSYNAQNSIYFLGGEKGNSPLKYDSVAYEKVSQDIDQATQAKLLKLKQVFDEKSIQFSTKLADSDREIGHVAFAPGTKISFVNLQVGRTDIDLKQEIHLEIGRIAFSKGKVLLGVANAFTGTGKAGGDLFVEVDADTAIEKFTTAFKTSVVVSDVKYWWDKTANIMAGETYASKNYTRVSGKVDVLDAIGLKAEDAVLAQRGYVPGGAIFDGVPVTGVRAGGVCYWATAWNTAMRMGLDTYGINYKVLTQSKHYDPNARYAPGTVYPYILGNKDFYDVTVAYSPVYGGVGSITQMEDGKAMNVKTTVLYANAGNGRFLAVTEATIAE